MSKRKKAAPPKTSVSRSAYEKIMGYRTAIPRGVPSRPMATYARLGFLKGSILDYGAGQDVHAFPRFDPAYAADYRLLNCLWDVVLVNYVLNVLPLEHNRAEVLLTVRGLLKPGGHALVSVWAKADEDIDTRSSFQCGWSRAEWSQFLERFFDVAPMPTADFWGWVCRPRPLHAMGLDDDGELVPCLMP